jgi:hypothetical protein
MKIPRTGCFILALFLIMNLCGCQSSPIQETVIPSSTVLTATPAKKGTSTPTATREPTTTVIPTSTSTALPVQNLEQNPALVQKGWTTDRLIRGRVVLEGMSILDLSYATSFPVQGPSYIWDLETGDKWELSIEEDYQRIDYFAISPDNSLLACWIETADGVTSFLRIVDNQGQILSETAHSYKEWFGMIDWYDDEHLMFDENNYTDSLDRESPGPFVVYNPFTQKTVAMLSSRVLPDAPFYSPGIPSWGGHYYSQMVLSPDHKSIAYLQAPLQLGFYNYDEQKLISSIDPNTSDFGPPDWSQDGTFFVVDVDVDTRPYYGFVGKEFFLANINGDVERLTYLANTYEKVEISGFQLSPDGKTIAFNLLTDETDSEFRVAIFDLETKNLVVFENLVSFKFPDYNPCRPPVWSPTSTQFMATIYKDDGEGFRTVLVDIEDGFIIELAEDVKPVGWMLSSE